MKNQYWRLAFSILVLCALLYVSLTPRPYPSERAIERGDVTITASGKYYVENFIAFLEKQRLEQRIVSYTDEGDAIILDLKHEADGKIAYTMDQRRDKY